MRLLIPLIMALALAACSPPPPPPPAPLPPMPPIPKASPLRLAPVRFEVHTTESLKALIADAEAKKVQITLITLSPDEMKKLQTNLVRTKRFVREQNAVNGYLIAIIRARSAPEPIE